ncbi:hypothetical protein MOC16_gp315 [Klebsiella phage vB_KpM_FBKp24]|uniref:CYTH domain-containing protein n=2 Tax=root TaxID=1 RepID=A0A7U0GBI3_9CAUD|nr:hypothetical protein MOC16_gp315 [Klebsiella phage vB_KpM_FBKp24]QQV92130.1 hypothetical protein vBKpMFBKp24_098 [Klebsiella phage vB_KpM_FBKp24]
MGKKKSNENEVAIFFKLDDASYLRLKDVKTNYLQITQSETNAMTQNNTRLTVRVRRTETFNGDLENSANVTLYEAATKYRLPYDPNTLTSRCIELEKVITQEEYEMALPFGERLYQKRRYAVDLGNGFVGELDWYFDKELNDFGYYCKLDINTPVEGLRPGQITTLLKNLPKIGIVISDLINPPWIKSNEIKNRISELMEKRWNLI